MQNCLNSENLVLKKQLIGINIDQKKSIERPNQYLDYSIDPNFQGVNRLFVLSFEDEEQQTSYKRYYLPTAEIKNYNVMIHGQHFFD